MAVTRDYFAEEVAGISPDRDYFAEEVVAQPVARPGLLEQALRGAQQGASRVEDLIAKRGGGNLGALQQEATNPRMLLLNALGLNPTRPGSQLDLGMKAVGAVGEQIEAPLASAGLAYQQRQPWSQVGSQMLKSVMGQRPAQLGDVIRAMGVPGLQSGPIPATLGLLGMAGLTGGLGAKAADEAIGATQSGLTRIAKKVFGTKPAMTNAELSGLTEAEVAKLPASLRSDYVKLKTQVATEALQPGFLQSEEVLAAKGQQAQEALQLKTIRQDQQLRTQRLDFQAQAFQIEQARKTQAQQLGQSAPKVAQEALQDLNGKFRPLQKAQSEAYASSLNNDLANAESASGSPITVTQEQLNQALAQKYLKPTQAGSPPIWQEENPQVYQELTGLLNEHGIVNQQEISARQLLNIAKAESKQVGAAAKQHLRAYTPREVAHQHLHDILLDVLKSRGVDVSATDAMWREWAPVRNLGLKLQTEQGPSKLISIVRGKNPVAAEHLKSLQAMLPDGQPLDATTRKVFEQLDTLSQQKVVEQAKALEFERVMQSQQSAFRQSKLAEKSALTTAQRTEKVVLSESQRRTLQGVDETAMEQTRRIAKLSQHREAIRKLIYAAGIGAATALGGYGAYKVGRPLVDVVTGQ